MLYSKIGDSLKEMGYSKEVKLLTTMVNDEVFNFKVKQNLKEATNLIFLSRVEEYKGIYELLKAYTTLYTLDKKYLLYHFNLQAAIDLSLLYSMVKFDRLEYTKENSTLNYFYNNSSKSSLISTTFYSFNITSMAIVF